MQFYGRFEALRINPLRSKFKKDKKPSAHSRLRFFGFSVVVALINGGCASDRSKPPRKSNFGFEDVNSEDSDRTRKASLEEREAYETAYCQSTSIKSIDMPLDHDNASVKTFTYRFRHVERESSLPTIIWIPGGPGDSMSSLDFAPEYLSNYNFILVDPRGIGCNYLSPEELPDELLTTSQHAKDIVELIAKLKPQKYALYGMSYGTVVATYVGHLLNALGKDVELPQAVVLEGVAGKAEIEKDSAKNKLSNWELLTNRVQGLENALAKEPLGISLEEWFEAIKKLLNYGDLDANLEIANVIARPSAFGDDEHDFVRRLVKKFNKHDGWLDVPGAARTYVQIGCREILPPQETVLTIKDDGKINVADFDEWLARRGRERKNELACMTNELVAPFDSANYQLSRLNVFYFQGELDPATPQSGARYHYDHQTETKNKLFIEVDGAGHRPLRNQLKSCENKIWDSIFSGSDVRELLNSRNYCLKDESGARAL